MNECKNINKLTSLTKVICTLKGIEEPDLNCKNVQLKLEMGCVIEKNEQESKRER